MSDEKQDSRKAINFDLSTNELENIFGKSNTGKAYSDVRHFMEKNDFEQRQFSGYVSVEPKTKANIRNRKGGKEN